MSRSSNMILGVGGLLLAALMAYTVGLEFWHGRDRPRDQRGVASLVAVYFPDRVLWSEFRRGVEVCAGKKLLTVLESTESEVVVSTPRSRRVARFRLHPVRGLRETREDVVRLVTTGSGPLALVGSSNTVLTAAVADALREAAGPEGGGPLLLVPWASSVLVERSEPSAGPMALLDIHPGRTFRYCLNNQYQADLVVRCLSEGEPGNPPRKVVLVEDRSDPYSVDLSSCFERAARRVAAGADIHGRSHSGAGRAGLDRSLIPSPEEDVFARSIWSEIGAESSAWIVVALQEQPARRMLAALRRQAPAGLAESRNTPRVICGDAVGLDVFRELAGHCPFPVWGVSSATLPSSGAGPGPDVQIPAEIVASLVACLDDDASGSSDPSKLREALDSLQLEPRDARSLGRSLAFGKSGERVGDDLGYVLLTRPDRPEVYSIARGPTGRLSEPVVVPADSVALQP